MPESESSKPLPSEFGPLAQRIEQLLQQPEPRGINHIANSIEALRKLAETVAHNEGFEYDSRVHRANLALARRLQSIFYQGHYGFFEKVAIELELHSFAQQMAELLEDEHIDHRKVGRAIEASVEESNEAASFAESLINIYGEENLNRILVLDSAEDAIEWLYTIVDQHFEDQNVDPDFTKQYATHLLVEFQEAGLISQERYDEIIALTD